MTQLPEYGDWSKVPPHLMTKTSLGKAGLRLAKGQKPTAIKTYWHYATPDYDLYDSNEAVPKRTMSPAQKAALEKARLASLKKRTCTQCGYIHKLGQHYRYKIYVEEGLCDHCRNRQEHTAMLVEAEQAAQEWAQTVLQTKGALILDTETTGIPGEIIEIEYELEESGLAVYEFDILQASGREIKLEINARNANINLVTR